METKCRHERFAGPRVGRFDENVMTQSALIPFSSLASGLAAEKSAEEFASPGAPLDADIRQLRAHYSELDRMRLERIQSRFAAEVETREIGGVSTRWLTPAKGVPRKNARRVLMNLHGGAFMWGRRYGSLVESIPIAVTGGFKVVAVHYRLAPEHRFPAASEDAAAVYAELLKDYDADSIGVYGCSAGGVLTAQLIAWLYQSGLPLPGAIGTFCGTGLELGGDSSTLWEARSGQPGQASSGYLPKLLSLPYFRDILPTDPLALPLTSREILSKFPPTLLLSGGRDFAASSLTLAHRLLTAAGCDSRLFLFDGLWHSFLLDSDLPESSEAYALICRFFSECLR